jgi:hypothetical protein
MTECDKCQGDVTHVWRHRGFETETHRTTEWVCATCHPDLPDLATVEETESPETVAVTDGGEADTSPEIRSDGGTAFACPDCSGTTVNGQGLFSCVDCNWAGPY